MCVLKLALYPISEPSRVVRKRSTTTTTFLVWLFAKEGFSLVAGFIELITNDQRGPKIYFVSTSQRINRAN